MSRWTYAAPDPCCHMIALHAHPDGDTPCGYMLEPAEVCGQTFTTDPTGVTCPECVAWLAREAEKKITGHRFAGRFA